MSEQNAAPDGGVAGDPTTPATTPPASAEPAAGAAPTSEEAPTPAPVEASAEPAAETASNWRDLLPKEIADAPALANYESPEALAQAHLELQSHLGNTIRIPGEGASAEDHAAFRAKLQERVPGLAELKADDPEAVQAALRALGAPEEASGYKLPETPEGMAPMQGWNEWAHEANLTQAQFDTLSAKYTQAQQQAMEQAAAEHNAGMETLHRELGYAFEQKMELARNAAKHFGNEELAEAIGQGRVSADNLRMLVAIGEAFGNEADIGADRRVQNPEMTPSEAQARYDEIMRNKEHPYWQRHNSPEKQRAIEEMLKLKERAMGPGSRSPHVVIGDHEFNV